MVTFVFFVSWDKDRRKIEEINHYKLIADAFLSSVQLNPTEEKLKKFYKDFSVKPIPMEKARAQISKHGKTVFGGKSIYGRVRVFEIGGEHYIYVQRLGYNLMLEDARPKNYNFGIASVVGISLIALLLLLYLAILKKLYPLKRLHREIERFAAGDLDVKISYKYDDEIGKIAKSFDDAIMHIKELIKSKNLFMRNMMHELKTPITKGRIVVESIDDESIKKILVRAFDRMNELINELAQVERVTTRNFEPVAEEVSLEEVIDQSRHLLMAEKGKVSVEIENMTLNTDEKLLALAIKNLLDNGIKYSKEKRVLIRSANEGKIEIVSRGEKLKYPLSYYTEPFSQEEKRSHGFGLGLYIVHNILEKLGCKLEYRYEEGENIFMIVLGEKC
jgi:two-component system OmpR family sensor kinase